LGKKSSQLGPRSATKVDVAIGARMRTRRLEIGMAQETLADKVGVTFQQIQKYERGLNRVASSTLIAVAKALDVKTSFLLFGEDEEQGGQGRELSELAQLYAGLNAAGQRMLLQHARSLASERSLKRGTRS
jgi:transcriptional regulator with XRE-family HTH domain